MALEIERKFLVISDQWRTMAKPVLYCQGYLTTDPDRTVRVRIAGDQATMTIKGRSTDGVCAEYEFAIDPQMAQSILNTLAIRPFIKKYRSRIAIGNIVWEVDEFLEENSGLILAEVELSDRNQVISLPNWIGQEVTGDKRFFNSALISNPYANWPKG